MNIHLRKFSNIIYKFLSNKKFFDVRSGKAERLRILLCQIFHLP